MVTIRDMCSQVLWLERGETQAFGEPEKVVNEYLSFIRSNKTLKA